MDGVIDDDTMRIMLEQMGIQDDQYHEMNFTKYVSTMIPT